MSADHHATHGITKRPKTMAPPPFSGAVAATVEVPPPASVFAMLRRDVEPVTGPRVLLPFFSTNDRLRLSECCNQLLRYRQLLTTMRIAQQPTGSPDSSIGQMLLRQEPGLLQHLAMEGDSGLLPALEPLGWMWCIGMRSLDLSGLRFSGDRTEAKDVAMTLLGLLEGGAFLLLEDLNLKGWLLPHQTIKVLFDRLGAGICPHLRRLAFPYDFLFIENVVPSLVEPSFWQLGMSGLEELDIGFSMDTSSYSMQRLLRSFEANPAAARLIRALELPTLNGNHLVVAAAALSSGVFVNLEVLKITQGVQRGIAGLMEAVEMGALQALKSLHITQHVTDMAGAGAAIARAITSPTRPALRELHLNSFYKHHPGKSGVFLQSLMQADPEACCSLRILDLRWCGMGPYHGELLGRSMERRVLPAVEELLVSYNPLMAQGVANLVKGLRWEKRLPIKRLELVAVGAGPEGVSALGGLADVGLLTKLQHLDISANPHIKGDAMAVLIKGLGHGCPDMRSLRVGDTGMEERSGEALVMGLRTASWRHLRVLSMVNSEDLPATWTVSLAGALVGRGGAQLERLEVACESVDQLAMLMGALGSGACPMLKELYIDTMGDPTEHLVEEEERAYVMEALEPVLGRPGLEVKVLSFWLQRDDDRDQDTSDDYDLSEIDDESESDEEGEEALVEEVDDEAGRVQAQTMRFLRCMLEQ